ncbi:MAG: hypothetical protein MUE85_21420 [Microscillaceae bacterium]|jgi:hypothetical protein|nr:hypothetical protein [Microscillaceae bacterium]
MKDKGYQIIEVPSLDYINTRYDLQELGCMVILWIINNLRDTFEEELEFDLIKVVYLGSYPAIGVHYLKQPASKSYEDEVIEKAEKILEDFSLSKFLSYVKSNHKLIYEEINNYKLPPLAQGCE